MKPIRSILFVVLAIPCLALLLRSAAPQLSSGTWASTDSMAQARSGASAVLLPDQRILIIGGDDASGPSATAELYGSDGFFASAAAMNIARSKHTSVLLADGRVLVAGGATSGGEVTSAAEIYDPATNSWAAIAGGMVEARAGHTATLLKDGRVLFAGGEGSSGIVSSTAEFFDPATGSFALAGVLSSPRKSHAAGLLSDGRVILVGGSVGSSVLASSDIYDPVTSSISTGPSLGTPRAGHSATTLLDGRLFVFGGNNGSTDLASAEILASPSGTFAPIASAAAIPRQRHLALLLPHNNSVLIVGGTSASATPSSVELFIPWTGAFRFTDALAGGRADAAGGALSQDGLLLVVGGMNESGLLASAELYGFATVKTDKDDYAPGEIVTITGAGWRPGETVRMVLEEANGPCLAQIINVTADASGNIFDNSFSPDEHDLGVRFYLTATGQGPELTAQTTFTDGTPRIDSVSNNPFSPNQASSTGVKDTTVITAKNQGGGSINDFRIRIRAGTVSGTLIRQFTFGSVAANGTVSATWDGKNTGGSFVADGTYIALASNGASETTSPANSIGTIVLDNTNPTLTLNSPADNAFINDSEDLVATPTDVGGDDSNIDKVEFYVDGALKGTDNSGSSGWKLTLNTSTLADGNHSWFAKAFDEAGNNTASASRILRVDNTKPDVAVDPVADGIVGSPITLTGTASDPSATASGVASVQVTITKPDSTTVGGSATNTDTNFSTWSFSFTPDQAGNYSVVAKATDNAGNFKNSSAVSFFVVADGTPPTTTIALGPAAPDGDNGWYKTNVHVSVSAADNAGGTGVAETRCVLDPASAPATFDAIPAGCAFTGAGADVTSQGLHTIYAASKDNAGNKETPKSHSFKMDKTAPAVSCGSADSNWHANDVSIACTADDSVSGLASSSDASFSLSTSVAANIEDANASTNGRNICDAAGNCAAAGPISGNKVDKKAPHLSGCESTDGVWHAGNVTLHCTYTDDGSGPASQQVSLTTNVAAGEESANAAASANGAQACDAMGNCAASPADISVNKVDRKAPQLSGCESPDGVWHAGNVTLHCTYTDGGSGPASQQVSLTTNVAAGEESANAAASANGAQACDAMGNCATSPADIAGNQVDKKAPSSSCGAADGIWHGSDVIIGCTASDGGSGLANAADANFSLSTNVPTDTETSNASTGAHPVCDAVGNCATAGPISGNKVDRKAPRVSCGSADAAWHNSDQSADCTADDSGSGLASSIDSSFQLSTSVPTGTEPEDAFTNSRNVCDAVNNCSTAGPVGPFKIDKKAPAISAGATANGAAYTSGTWTKYSVIVSFTCTDGGSGVNLIEATGAAGGSSSSSPLGVTVTTEGDAQAVNGTCTDGVGNSAGTSFSEIRVDKTAPTLTFGTQSPLPNAAGWNNTNVTIPFTTADNLSGVASALPNPLVLTAEGTAVTGTVTVTDVAGNSATFTSPAVKIDKTKPTINAPSDLVVACTQLMADGRGCVRVDNPSVAAWLASASAWDSLSGAPTVTNIAPSVFLMGYTMVTFNATDLAGNPADPKTAKVQVVYTFGGFLPPLLMDGSASIKQSKLGRTIPVKFQLLCNGTPVGTAVASISVYKMIDAALGTMDTTNLTEDSGSANSNTNLFRYDATSQQYIYNLSTKGFPAPATYRLIVYMDDGTEKYVDVSLRY